MNSHFRRTRNLVFAIVTIGVFFCSSCSKEDYPLRLRGSWNCSFEIYDKNAFSSSFGYFSWEGKAEFLKNGSGSIIHGSGNPIFGVDVEEFFDWELINNDSLYFSSNNWSVTDNMYFNILEYSNKYVSLMGFDGERNQWYVIMHRSE